MQEWTQDHLAYVQQYDNSDLFITFTFNPKCEEFQEVLLPGQNH